jgi:glycosyltransferase involved in cell wall biosynthesis
MDYRLAPFSWTRLQAAAQLGPILGLEMSAETSEYAWDKVSEPGKFARVTLFPEGESRTAPRPEMRRCLRAALDRHHPCSVAIVGWSFDWSLTALDWCLENQVPAILLSDSTAISNPRLWWKEAVKRRLVKLFSAGLVAGTPQREYLEELGMPRSRIFHGWDVVDNDFYITHSEHARREADALRNRLGLPEKYFLAVNRFIDVKNLRRLVEAYAAYRKAAGAGAWKLVLTGDGPLKPQILEWRRHHGLEDDLLLPGFKQYAELPAYYALAGAFVLASTSETWGLVVNEAMASGLPVLVSRHCGCAKDLVAEGRNGFTFDPLNVEALTRVMQRMAAPELDRAAMSRASREIIAHWTPARWAQNLQLASQAARSTAPPKFGRADRLLLHFLIQR